MKKAFHYAATFTDGSMLTFYANNKSLAYDHAVHCASGLFRVDGSRLLVGIVRRARPEDRDTGRWAERPRPTSPRTLTVWGAPVEMRQTRYVAGGGIAIQLYTAEGDALLTLTTNIESALLEPDEFCVKNWSENAPYIEELLACGVFEDTGKRVMTGFVEAPVWRFKR